ncbi:MAG: FKBP-type peptidyl-prolyl cis-trans isomerase [Treponema sp.]|nr:FKBP-type peptidyl-prolyl cis-trans isomerase [Treponema sp.]
MKKFAVFSVKMALALFVSLALLGACKKGDKTTAQEALDKDTSYAFGMYLANFMGSQMGLTDLRFDYNSFMDGFKAYNEAKETRLTQDQAMEKIKAAFTQLQAKADEKMKVDGEKNKKEGEAYLAENAKKSGVTTTASGLQYEVITEGTGAKPLATDTVRVNYEGTFIDGKVFDSSYKRGQPAEFPVGHVIPGWAEGVQLMSVGSTYRFVVPSDLAYGPNGAQTIPPNATLIFKVELLDIVKQ